MPPCPAVLVILRLHSNNKTQLVWKEILHYYLIMLKLQAIYEHTILFSLQTISTCNLILCHFLSFLLGYLFLSNCEVYSQMLYPPYPTPLPSHVSTKFVSNALTKGFIHFLVPRDVSPK